MHEDLISSFALDGMTAVVTGAASGIGRETARILAQAGAVPVIADVDEAGLSETAAMVGEAGVTAEVCRTNVANRTEVNDLASLALRKTGRIDIWVNVAGVIVSRPIMEAEETDLDRVIGINLKGVYWGCAAAGRAMKDAGKGTIVNMSSGGGESPVEGLSIYSMTKAGVNMLTRTAAKEFGPFGIRVNAIAPGWIDTPMGTHSFRDETGAVDPEKLEVGLRSRAQASPLGLTGTPRDIALAVLYLTSDASRFVTGQILRPNGGVAMP